MSSIVEVIYMYVFNFIQQIQRVQHRRVLLEALSAQTNSWMVIKMCIHEHDVYGVSSELLDETRQSRNF